MSSCTSIELPELTGGYFLTTKGANPIPLKVGTLGILARSPLGLASMRNLETSPDRRSFLRSAGCGFGALALAAMLAEERPSLTLRLVRSARAEEAALTSRPRSASSSCSCPAGRRTSIPSTRSRTCTRLHGQKLPASFGPVKTRRGVDKNKLLASKRTFKKHGKSGIEVSDWFPHIAERASTTSASCAAATATASRTRSRST